MKSRNKVQLAQATKKAVDSYPGGICFSMPGGRPILVNKTMNRLIFTLTGHILLEGNATWDELSQGQVAKNCNSLKDVGWLQCTDGGDEKSNLFFMLDNQQVWHFQRKLLQEGKMVQMTATDITRQYRISAELYHNNCQLMALHERQRVLLQNIVQINQGRELLETKMRIHDELGQCLLGIEKMLDEKRMNEEYTELTKTWKVTLGKLYQLQPTADPSTEAELLQVARMIGCDIIFRGPRPRSYSGAQLFYAAVREAVMNAVSHAHADQLLVETQERERDYLVRISDNGSKESCQLREGVGLTGLRRCLEREGATMTVESDRGVVMHLEIPKEGEEK